MEIIQERIEREFGIELIATAPSVIYQCILKSGEEVSVDNPANMPDRDKIETIYEPFVRATMMVPNDYVGAVMELCQRKRGHNKESDLVKMDILLNGEKVDALSFIVHKEFAYERGKTLVDKLKTLIPRQQFEVPVQAAVGQKIVARTNIKSMGKNVLSKCYGGDITRKRKLLEKQKAGKAKMKAVGNVEIPQDAFLAVLKMDED